MSRRHLSASAGLAGVALLALAAAGPASAAGEPVTRSGVLEVLHEDHLDTGRSVHQYRLLDAQGKRTALLFDDRGPEGLGAKSVRVTGTQVRPGVVRVGSTSAVAETGETSGGTTAESATAATQKKVVVVMYDFANSDMTLRPVDVTKAQATVFGNGTSTSVNGFLADTSFAQLTMVGANDVTDGITGDVFDWVRIPSSSTDPCDFDKWGAEARELAVTQGFVDSAYTQVIHLMPRSTCTFGGVAYMPGKYSWTVLGASATATSEQRLRGVTSHEFGHSLGIHHAGTWSCTDRKGNPVTLGTSCTLTEYGDAFSAMGQATLERQYHGYQKGRLGWLSDSSDTLTVTYPLASVSTNSSTAPQVLRIARPRTKGQGGDFYYLELRQSAGTFDSFKELDPVTTGVSVRIAPEYTTNSISKLLDMTPGSSAGFADAALQPTKTFTDTSTGLRVTVNSVTDGLASVTVTMPTSNTGPRRK